MFKLRTWTTLGIIFNLATFSVSVQASENIPAKIQGTGVELFERAHSFAGSILDTPVFGVFEESPFGATVEIRKNGKTLQLKLSLSQISKIYSGEIIDAQTSEANGEVKDNSTYIELTSLKKTAENSGEIGLMIDGETILVKITGESFENGHFQSPRFETVLGGKSVKFEFTGKACFKYSLNIAMMVLATYAHLTKY